jgi:hypothetical protein
VEALKLIRHLSSSGHSLNNLAGLDIESLRELAGLHDEGPLRINAEALALIGPNVARALSTDSSVSVRKRFTGDLAAWEEDGFAVDREDTVIVESETVPPTILPKLVGLRGQVKSLTVVYTFVSTRTLNQLVDEGIDTIQGPLSDRELRLHLDVAAHVTHSVAPRGRRFTSDELARIAALNPGLKCECPNHIAKLLMDISSFEKYCRECIDTDPDERLLHTRLGEISSRARELFEDALIAVATADGIPLSIRE